MASPRVHPLVRLALAMSAVFLAVLAWFVVAGNPQRDAEGDEGRQAVPTTGISAPVREFLSFADGRGVPAVGREHDYAAVTGRNQTDLRTAAAGIDPDRPLLQQTDSVRGFFATAARAMREHEEERGTTGER
jgi:hypothetical protein